MRGPQIRGILGLLVPLCTILLTACGGGGGGNNSANLESQDDTSGARLLTYTEDIEPILQARCIGCHNDGENPLAPFSLDGENLAKQFQSAIHFTVEAGTMPPVGAVQLTQSEKSQLIAWSTGQPYDASGDILRIGLIEAEAWRTQPRNRDAFFEHRPEEDIDCDRDRGWFVEDDALEVRTEFCNYASLTQQALLDLPAGTEVEINFSHSILNFNAPSSAHVALTIAGTPIWEQNIAIPNESALIKEIIELPAAVAAGDSIEIHIHNHGANTWTLHSLIAILPGDTDVEFCASYESTFEAIQDVVFERAGCANSLCHGEAAEGGLDLRPDVAWENLVGVLSENSSLNRVEPRGFEESYLYHKLSAKTFPGSYAVAGAPMPSAGQAITPGQLEAVRLWIAAGAPKEGSIGDFNGEGEDELERLLGVCLPEPEAINVLPLPPPDPTRGLQFAMPPHEAPAEEETEICFAVYEDFRDVIPEEYMTPDREYFYVHKQDRREDPFTHHNVLFWSAASIDDIHHPSLGAWTCAGGDTPGASCEPTDLASCGAGKCRSESRTLPACRGYGPPVDLTTAPGETPDDALTGGGLLPFNTSIIKDGFYEVWPTHGIFYWNSHAFNLTTEDAMHHVWNNYFYADDRRFQAQRINGARHIFAATGTPAFGKKTVCRDFVYEQGDGLLSLAAHFHKRGERFWVNLDGEMIYENFSYDEPVETVYDPAIVFNSHDPAERTIEYCATYNNGVNADGTPNIDTVVRRSQRPPNAGGCRPVACVAGNIGAPCNGADDDAACDSSPGAGDGWCDACNIALGITSDDEMFIIRGSRLPNHDAVLNTPGPDQAQVAFVSPATGQVYAPGSTVFLEFDFDNFTLAPPEGHGDDGHDHSDGDHHNGGDHSNAGGDHSGVTMGHYHVYLDTEDDDADHLTAWGTTAEFELPDDIALGEHELRVSLRAPDHHAVGAEARVTIVVE